MAFLRNAAIMSMLSISACAVGPDYKGPPGMVPADRPFARASTVEVDPAPALANWWTQLNDPQLDQLEAAALANSPDLDAASARVRSARAQLRSRHADLLPSTGANALYVHLHSGAGPLASLAGASAASSASNDSNLYSLGFDASWEIDIFGGKRRAVEVAAAAADAQAASLADTQVTLTAEVARAYVTLRDLQHRVALQQSSATLQQQMLALGRQRLAGGTASDFDVERLNQQVQKTVTDIVPFQAQIDAQLNQLAILVGRLPGELDAELVAPKPVPLPPTTVAIGDPATLIRQRPDIRQAERTIASKNAAIGQNIANYFPKLELLGDIGYTSTDINQLLTPNAFSLVVAPVVSWKPFDFGRTAAGVAKARADYDEAVATYRSTVLRALGDVEDSLSKYGYQRRQTVGLEQTYGSAARAAALARQRYASGTITLTDQLDTERQRFAAEQDLAEGQANVTANFVALQKSLGLAWRAAPVNQAAGK
jgi:NodT family efflux transporter outer membrane factor (OMF) lipoprotein